MIKKNTKTNNQKIAQGVNSNRLLDRFTVDRSRSIEETAYEFYMFRGKAAITIYRKVDFLEISKEMCWDDEYEISIDGLIHGELKTKSLDRAMQFVEYISKFRYKKVV